MRDVLGRPRTPDPIHPRGSVLARLLIRADVVAEVG